MPFSKFRFCWVSVTTNLTYPCLSLIGLNRFFLKLLSHYATFFYASLLNKTKKVRTHFRNVWRIAEKIWIVFFFHGNSSFKCACVSECVEKFKRKNACVVEYRFSECLCFSFMIQRGIKKLKVVKSLEWDLISTFAFNLKWIEVWRY